MFERQPWMQRAGEYPGSDREYFSLLARTVFSGGLGPRVVEARWPGLCAAFHEFDPLRVAAMDEGEVSRLLSDPGVIRNRRKIEAVIADARIFLDTVAEHGSFHNFIESLGAAADFAGAADALAERFEYLGRTSASLYLFSSGWRVREPLASEVAA